MKNWDDIRYFLAVARMGSITAAARQLGVNHSTVSRRIDQMEKSLSVRLFDRFQSGYRISVAGHDILQLAEKMEHESVAIERQLKGRDLEPSGELTIATPDVTVLDLTALLVGFLEQYSSIKLRVIAGSSQSSLEHMEADVAIRLTSTPSDELVGKCIANLAFAPYAAKRYLERKSLNLQSDIATMAQYDWLDWEPERVSSLRESWRLENTSDINFILRTNAPNNMFQAARAGLGIAIMPCYIGNAEPDLVQLDIPGTKKHIGIWLLTHKDLRSTKRVRLFIDYIKREASDWLKALENY